MSIRESPRQRGARRGRWLLHRVGDELRAARVAAGLSALAVGTAAGCSHTQVYRIERGVAPHVDVDLLARLAAVLGLDLTVGVFPIGSPLRDAAHVALLERLRRLLPPTVRWRTEVPVPIQGDHRSGDAVMDGADLDALVEAETRLGDLQALERSVFAKARDLGVRRVVLLVADTRHNRAVIRAAPALQGRFPIPRRVAMAALRAGRDPGGDCLILL